MGISSTTVRISTQALVALFGIALGTALGWSAIRGADWAEVWAAIGDMSIWVLPGAFALHLASLWLRAMRWRYTWVSHRVSTLRLFLVENAALGINNISPIRVWDEFASLAMLVIRDKLPPGAIVATLIMTRAQDLAFTLTFVGVGSLMAPELREFGSPIAAVSATVFVMFMVSLNLGRVVEWVPVLKRIPGITSYGDAVTELWVRKRRLTLTFGLTTVYWLLLGPVAYLIGRGLGIELSLFQFTLIVLGSLFFATITPGLPGAVGTFEFATVRLLGIWDVPQDTAISFAVLLHLVLFMPPVVIAMFVLPRDGLLSLPAWRRARARASAPSSPA